MAALAGVTRVSSTAYHSLALTGDGYVWAWGADWAGQLGGGSPFAPGTPVLVTALHGITAVAAGGRHSVALRSDGTVRAWGLNASGQLGNGTTFNSTQPVDVVGLEGVVSIAAGEDYSLALRGDGIVFAWGSNGNGQLGDGSTTSRATPRIVVGLTEVTAIAAGPRHCLALRSDGSVWSWGAADYDPLGGGAVGNRTEPAVVPGLTGVVVIAAGGSDVYGPVSYSLALRAGGSLWSWGTNTQGELGDGTQDWRPVPEFIPTLPPLAGIAAGASHALAWTEDGRVWAWGANAQGQLGDWTTTARFLPAQVAAPNMNWLVATPSLTTAGGTYAAAFSASLTDATPGATVHYTLDGGEPTDESPTFDEGVFIDRSLTLKARAYRAGFAPSLVATAAYSLKLPAPQISPTGGTLRHATRVRVGCEGLRAATVHYRLGVGEPVEADPEIPCELGLAIDASTPLSVKAWRQGWEPSDTTTATFVITAPLPVDSDGDGLSDAEETTLGSDPHNPDTNGDGLPDGAARAAGLSATDVDMDHDGLTNPQELAVGTDPFDPDSDKDGVADGADCFPLNPARSACLPSNPDDHSPPAILLSEPVGAVLLSTNP